MGSPGLHVVVPDMDRLHTQSLGLGLALLVRPPVSLLLHLLGHVFVNMGIEPCHVNKLPLDLDILPDAHHLLMTPDGSLPLYFSGYRAQHGSMREGTWWVSPGQWVVTSSAGAQFPGGWPGLEGS